MSDYIQKVIDGTTPIWAACIAWICYVLFPLPSYKTAFFVVAATIALDTYTKMASMSKRNGGYVNARKTKIIVSRLWWDGLWKKIQTLFYVSILAGLSYRVSPLAEVGVFLATFVYAMMFLREAQSILENMDDAGHDVGWFLLFVKRKQEGLMDQQAVLMEKQADLMVEQADLMEQGGKEREH